MMMAFFVKPKHGVGQNSIIFLL